MPRRRRPLGTHHRPGPHLAARLPGDAGQTGLHRPHQRSRRPNGEQDLTGPLRDLVITILATGDPA